MESENEACEDTCEDVDANAEEGERPPRRKPGDRLTASMDKSRRGGPVDPGEDGDS